MMNSLVLGETNNNSRIVAPRGVEVKGMIGRAAGRPDFFLVCWVTGTAWPFMMVSEEKAT
jgi:hypothetical protein